MKVYIVCADNGDNYLEDYEEWIVDVFDSYDKAVEHIERNPNMVKKCSGRWVEYDCGRDLYDFLLSIDDKMNNEEYHLRNWIEEWEVH